jgi:putative ABC transport system substrate-binding protein
MAGFYPGQYPPEMLAILKEALRAKGYLEGRNLALDIRDGDGTPERLNELYRQLVNDKVDVLLAHSNVNALAAKQATSKVPIVMLYALNPVGLGVVKSLGRPGGNVTGMSYDPAPEHTGKLVELLKQSAPSVTRLGVLAEPALYGEAAPLYWQAAENAARALRLASKRFEVTRAEDVDGIFQAIAESGMNGLVVLGSNIVYRYRGKIVSLAARYRLPTAYALRPLVEAGGLMSYGPDPTEHWRLAAIYVDRLLKGATPADLPMQQPTRMIFAVNLKTARALGLTIPQSLLLRADEVIE